MLAVMSCATQQLSRNVDELPQKMNLIMNFVDRYYYKKNESIINIEYYSKCYS